MLKNCGTTLNRHLLQLSYQRKALRMLDDLLSEIDIEIGPKEVSPPWLFNLQDRCGRRTLEPGKLLVGKKQLFVARKQPDPLSANMAYLNSRSARAKRVSSMIASASLSCLRETP